MQLTEMAVERALAIELCINLGEQFVDHFKKIYNEVDKNTIKHHASEMQAWYDKVSKIKLKSNKKQFINEMQLYDWFITCGSDILTVCDGDEELCYCYEAFASSLLNETDDVIVSLVSVGLL